ncbi:Thiamine biosynthesis lipoprotein ApbE precursor [Limihaloglobus sulfuriphilus]|uniref:FAD:protein FMN transferase n=1 Tax=Limihaloglobus sulfuriphilus TaxID=1851148 RepID=A0A1Q2MEV5_9BACT|nr:FAD:protein FMN transferase [Limihaloglobus sulfuriphilus]AQQ71235.1 Thiamine biosynthesis lipoprotein ApbE precursor [Limihaloglobus sulfuriphilus]
MKNKSHTLKIVFTVLIIVFLLLIGTKKIKSHRSGQNPGSMTFSLLIMDTYARITAVGLNEVQQSECAAAVDSKLRELETKFSYYLPESELSRINSTAGTIDMHLSDEMFAVIYESIKMCRLTDGAFDVTIASIEDLWKQAHISGVKPAADKIAAARELTGCGALVLDPENKTLKFAAEGVKIDLGGIAKGYAIDQVYNILRRFGASGGIIDIGGDMRLFGRSELGKKWLVGIQDPQFAFENGPASVPETLKRLELSDVAVATSGHYRRFTTFGDERMSHIIDPRLAAGSDKTASVTILAASAMQADALATAVSVMGAEKGLDFVNSLDGVEAVIIENNSADILYSRGAKQFITD